MANKTLRLEVREGYRRFAVLDTPCFPRQFYAGPVTGSRHDSENMPADNSTCNYHMTVEEAHAALTAEMIRVDAELKERRAREDRYKAIDRQQEW